MSMIRTLLMLAAGAAVLAALAPTAAAEWYEGKPDCADGEVCTMSEGADDPQSYGPEDCIACSGPAPGNDSEPIQFGPDGCIDCSVAPGDGRPQDDCVDWCPRDGEGDGPSAPVDCGGEVCAYDGEPQLPGDGATCMDGQQGSEVCDDDVQYLGPSPGPGAGGASGPSTTEAQGAGAKAVPGLGAIAMVAGLGAAGALVAVLGRRP